MPHNFVKSRVGSTDLAEAVRQQKQLSYFTQSSIQQETSLVYLDEWAKRKFQSDDFFLNYVKSVFRTDNFLAFFKFFRQPIASSELVNERIRIPLERVFFSEDSFFKYNISGEAFTSIPELNPKQFDKDLFNALLFRHNDILVTGLSDINTPFRELISIENVVAINSSNSVIHQIAYSAVLPDENGRPIKGILFIDAFQFIFFNEKNEVIAQVPHDLGETPADFISNEAFSDKDAVRKSLFSFVREKFEEYVFLKTLQRMTEPNGVIPIVTMLKARDNKDENDIKGNEKGEPMASNLIGGQKARIGSEIEKSNSLAQAGTQIKVTPIRKDDGSIDMAMVENFFNFFHMPIEPLNYINTRIKEIEQSLMVSLVGDFSEANEAAKNELQVSKSFKNQQNKLRSLSVEMSRIRNLSDFKFLVLANGKDNVQVDCFYGSDFFLESQEDLNELFKSAPNPIERQNVLIKSARNRNRFNPMKRQREEILYHLLPYCSDKDFETANEKGIDPILFQYQTRFNYWIGLFEAEFGDILVFWQSLEGSNDEKIKLINSLITQIIIQSSSQEAEGAPKDEGATKAAQAALRGSVGGVTGIVSMLTALGLGQIKDASSVVKILTTLYGLSEADAKEIAKEVKTNGEEGGSSHNSDHEEEEK